MHLSAVETVQTGLSGEIAKLRAKGAEFQAAYNKLVSQRPDPAKFPAQYKKWEELKAYGDKTKSSIAWILNAIDTAGNVIDSIAYGIRHPFGFNPFGLGVLPLIPIAGTAITGAVIASSIAAITYFVKEAYQYSTYANASPEVRAALTARDVAGESNTIGGMLSSVKGILIIGAVIYFAPKILAMVKARGAK